MLGEKNVPGVAAIHHPLRHVYPGAGDIRLFVQIGDRINRTAVDSHSDPKFGMLLELLTDFQRAADRRFGASAEHKGATIAGR